MTPSTARRFAAAKASSGRWTAKKALSTCCGSTSSSGWKARSPPSPSPSQRQLADVEATLAKIEAQAEAVEEIDIEDVDADDPAFESLLVGRKVKVLLQDVDRVRWRQDLIEDRNRLATLLSAAKQVGAARDAKLEALREVIERKCRAAAQSRQPQVARLHRLCRHRPVSLSASLPGWAQKELGLHSALVTGTGHNQTTLPNLRKDFASIITAFSPRSKERPEDLAGEGEIDLLIATDCISEGQNLQDCDTVINYDIHWNPVRIIQRFGRIDRIGSPNERIQLINFWPNMELEEYINLEQRVSGRMVLLDISATGEENIIEHQSGNQMNDLEYRRKQLLKLQDAVIDLEDLSSGVSIADLTLNDFRIDLAGFFKEHAGNWKACRSAPLPSRPRRAVGEAAIPPGVIFCLRAVGEAALKAIEPGYPLAPHYVVHVGDDGAVLLPFTQAKQALDRLKRLCIGRDLPDAGACARFDKTTKNGKDMSADSRPARHGRRLHRRQERGTRRRQPVHARRHPCHEGRVPGHQRLRGRGLPCRAPGGGKRMSFAPVIDALAFPPDARVDQRVPKKLLLEQGAPTAADKRQIQDGIEEMIWVAALKPTNIGVPAFRDDVREYLEIAVLTVTLRAAAKPPRLIELIHRAIPYPLVLVDRARRYRQPVAGAQTLVAGRGGQGGHRGRPARPRFNPDAPTAEEAAFLASLAVSRLPLATCSRSIRWLDRVAALEAAQITGTFAPPDSADQRSALREGLDTHARLQRDLDYCVPRQKRKNRSIAGSN